MENIFGKLKTEGLETQGDRLGGGQILESNTYDGKIKVAYTQKSTSSDAMSVVGIFDFGGIEYRETFWVINKNGENFYINKNDPNKKSLLPGYELVDTLALMSTGIPLNEQPMEEKVVSIYDFDAKKELPKNVPVFVDMVGKPITAAILKITEIKQIRDSSNNFVDDPTGATRDVNQVDKFFHQESKRTTTEVREGQEEPIFYPKWLEKNKGKTRDKTKGRGASGDAPKAGAPGGAATGTTAKPRSSLFGPKQ